MFKNTLSPSPSKSLKIDFFVQTKFNTMTITKTANNATMNAIICVHIFPS